jgi:hypothetical protein
MEATRPPIIYQVKEKTMSDEKELINVEEQEAADSGGTGNPIGGGALTQPSDETENAEESEAGEDGS